MSALKLGGANLKIKKNFENNSKTATSSSFYMIFQGLQRGGASEICVTYLVGIHIEKKLDVSIFNHPT